MTFPEFFSDPAHSFRVACVAVVVCALSSALVSAAPGTSKADALDRDASARVVLRKCVAGNGGIAYQSAPCASGSRELWSRDAEPAAPPTSTPKIVDTLALKPPRVRAVTASDGGGRPSTRQDCDAARREAARKRDREWNRLKFDDLSRLDAWVAERCR